VDTDSASPEDLAALRAAFPDSRGLGWENVHRFEREHGVLLPEPYRTFVADICNGYRLGPPHYGMTALGDLPSDWGANRPPRILARPFPLTAEWFWGAEENPPADLDVQLAPVFNDGSIVLGTDGCGMYWHLIVTGDHRGHVWIIDDNGALPFGAPFGHSTAAPGFAGWIRRWATRKGAHAVWFDLL
jgi:hypothetical protein